MKKFSLILILSCLSFSLFAASNNNNLNYSGLGIGYSYINYKHNDNNIINVYGPNLSIRGESMKNDATSHYTDLSIAEPELDHKYIGNINVYDLSLLFDYSTGINLLSSYEKGNYHYIGLGTHVNALVVTLNDYINIDSFVGVYINAGFKSAIADNAFIDISYKASYDFFGYNFNNDSSRENNSGELENYTCFGQAVNIFITYKI